ncbi:DMT family transporter [Abyssibius alkaniclasticus]|uniref:DMT family transporter n=1 Tax=Abyssibius alkaniclasticus TaxID=2881234 RepID=UPI00236383D6|nr:DMT family transporter [Abyssibius alkaniclasticus]UPH71531.1 DMT family transporter [Abyssibius alkaniclasticus]|tara:strand:- start:73 stop:897 length:825 start_codon:yes stop_codon:yes gene_type:complete
MKITLITLLALVAFAANSVLARAALADGAIDAAAFTAIRIASGAVVLALLLALRQKNAIRFGNWPAALALLLYAAAFSFAYLSLDAGLGALILFGAVQITMFTGGIIEGERPQLGRWLGMGLGLVGLAVLFVPGAATPSAIGSALMLAAGVGWGIYSLLGRHTKQPLAATAGNFLRAAPLGLLIWALVGGGANAPGIALAVASGALASGLGYAIWYYALPKLDASLAAIAQLCVPIIALGGGIIWLAESPTPTFMLASALILGGIGLAVYSRGK